MGMDLVVIDCQYDFIEGSLACKHAKEAVNNIIDFINNNDVNVYYTLDWHTATNKSFEINGGVWPVHCVQNQNGSKLDDAFYEKLIDVDNRPNDKNMFYKGIDDEIEEYSAFYAKNSNDQILGEILQNEVVVCGIASEFCVRETILDLLNSGRKVKVFLKGIGYVDEDGHNKNLADLVEKRVDFI